jgi:glycosyltransferase involved in cell wall biosynthesis
MKSVLFYDDAPEFGGHQVMTVLAAESLAEREDVSVGFVFYEENAQLARRLNAIKSPSRKIQLYPVGFGSGRLQLLRTLASSGKIGNVAALIGKLNPDVVVVSQGRIEASSLGLMAAKRAGAYTISYIPMAHPVAMVGSSFLAGVRDSINSRFYRLPDKIITISESSRRMLLARGAKPEVVVVPNAVERPCMSPRDREDFRGTHHIEKDTYVVAILGRIQFKQKGQDFALQAVASFRNRLSNFQFLIVGSGPDEEKLRNMIAKLSFEQQVRVLPWKEDLRAVYAGIDMLLIPSRFEGVPLVMLEAMSAGVPIVASNVDGMAELLPHEWLFLYGDCEALIDRLRYVAAADNTKILESHKNRVAQEFTMAMFRKNFVDAVLGEGPSARGGVNRESIDFRIPQ